MTERLRQRDVVYGLIWFPIMAKMMRLGFYSEDCPYSVIPGERPRREVDREQASQHGA